MATFSITVIVLGKVEGKRQERERGREEKREGRSRTRNRDQNVRSKVRQIHIQVPSPSFMGRVSFWARTSEPQLSHREAKRNKIQWHRVDSILQLKTQSFTLWGWVLHIPVLSAFVPGIPIFFPHRSSGTSTEISPEEWCQAAPGAPEEPRWVGREQSESFQSCLEGDCS